MTHRGGRRRVRQPDPGASSGSWPGNFSGEVAAPSSSFLAGTCARGGGGGGGGGGVAGIASHGRNPFGLKMVQNDLVWGPQVLENFSRVLELKNECVGLGFYLARKTRFT